MRMRHRGRVRKRISSLSDVSMTPLIDTALTLLIIFMVSTPALQNVIKVTLPRGNAQENTTQEHNELIVFIDKNGDFYINKEKIEKTNLIASIKKIIGDNNEKTVYVKADTTISYGTVIELVDNIKFIGGIKYVALATQKYSQKTPSLG